MHSAPHHPLIWLTRPLADSEALAAELATHGIHSVVAPVMAIIPQPVTIPTQPMPAALLLTSRHSAHVLSTLPAEWHHLPVYCIGTATAQAATAHGYLHTIAGDADMLSLLPRITADLTQGQTLLYLSGEETRTDVAALLATHGIHVSQHVVYHTTSVNSLPETMRRALTSGHVTAIALYSPRSAALACHTLHAHGFAQQAASIDAYCLSLPVVHSAATLPWRSLHSCHHPTHAAMVDLIVSHFHKTL